MKLGFVIPWADAEDVRDLAAAAEGAGWDGIFVWEPVWGVDAWIALGLAAARTTRIRLGTMLTPPSRRRPWELASQVATVDRISSGRVTLSVGLGAIDSGFETFGQECDRRVRDEYCGRLPAATAASSSSAPRASPSPTAATADASRAKLGKPRRRRVDGRTSHARPDRPAGRHEHSIDRVVE